MIDRLIIPSCFNLKPHGRNFLASDVSDLNFSGLTRHLVSAFTYPIAQPQRKTAMKTGWILVLTDCVFITKNETLFSPEVRLALPHVQLQTEEVFTTAFIKYLLTSKAIAVLDHGSKALNLKAMF